jgi:hypothetical protein
MTVCIILSKTGLMFFEVIHNVHINSVSVFEVESVSWDKKR